MAEIFISHIHEEVPQADALSWYIRDPRNQFSTSTFSSSSLFELCAGEEWLTRIRNELLGCKILLSLLSPQSITRPWINFEGGAAWVNRKLVIPCCHGGLRKGALPPPWSSLHAIELPDELYALTVGVSKTLNPNVPPPPPVQLDDPLEVAVTAAFEGRGWNSPLVAPPPKPPA